jgi:hypothetical protein
MDDNLIGNKKAIKEVLRAVRAWQVRAWHQERGYPLTFFTEASIDLADHPELLRLLVEINLVAAFIGIETRQAPERRQECHEPFARSIAAG